MNLGRHKGLQKTDVRKEMNKHEFTSQALTVEKDHLGLDGGWGWEGNSGSGSELLTSLADLCPSAGPEAQQECMNGLRSDCVCGSFLRTSIFIQ